MNIETVLRDYLANKITFEEIDALRDVIMNKHRNSKKRVMSS